MRVEIVTQAEKDRYRADLYCWKDGKTHRKSTEGTYAGTKDAVELAAVIAGLERMVKPSEITIKTASDYVTAPFRMGWFAVWKENGWLNQKGKLIRNAELWQRLAILAEPHQITVERREDEQH